MTDHGATAPAAFLRRLVRIWDDAVRIPGTALHVGLDPILGLVPGVGDALGGLVASYVVLTALLAGAPAPVVGRMLLNLALDTVLGAVPLVGDLFDVGFRANRRNLALFERWLSEPGRTARSSRLTLAALVGTVLLVLAATVYAGYRSARAAVRLLALLF